MTKQETLTDEQIAFIVAWAESGNEWRASWEVRWIENALGLLQNRWNEDTRLTEYCLNPPALTIVTLTKENAKLRAALEQANAIAEGLLSGIAPGRGFSARQEMAITRENKRELLK